MIIRQSSIAFESGHSLDVMERETYEKEIVQQSKSRARLTDTIDPLAQVIVDRVSISQQADTQVVSGYSAKVTGRSTVSSVQDDSTETLVRQAAIEKIAGSIIDEDVAVGWMQSGLSVSAGNEDKDSIESQRLALSVQSGSASPRRQKNVSSTRASEISITSTRIRLEEETAWFSSQGSVVTEDGRNIDFSLDMSVSRSLFTETREETLIQRWQERVNLTDPLVISLDGQAPLLTDTVFDFDLDSDGEAEHINFTGSGSGFLSLDRNGDGVINNGSELFGPETGSGFEELAAFDDDGNGWIDEADAVFDQLTVWTKDADGQDHLISLKDAGIGAVNLGYVATPLSMTGEGRTAERADESVRCVFCLKMGLWVPFMSWIWPPMSRQRIRLTCLLNRKIKVRQNPGSRCWHQRPRPLKIRPQLPLENSRKTPRILWQN